MSGPLRATTASCPLAAGSEIVVLPSVVFQVPSAVIRPPEKSVTLAVQRSTVLNDQVTSWEAPATANVITTLKVQEDPGAQAALLALRATLLTEPADAGAKTGTCPGGADATAEGELLGEVFGEEAL